MITITIPLSYVLFLLFSALALQYMRAQNVSHMDLKPQNILLSSKSSPILKVAGEFHFPLPYLETLMAVTTEDTVFHV